MTNEKIRIMEMVKDGTISPEEGIDLIEALSKADHSESEKPLKDNIMAAEPVGITEVPETESRRGIFGRHRMMKREHRQERRGHRNGRAKWLYIQVEDDDGKTVNIKIPLTLAKFAGKFIPNDAKKELKEQGIELDLDGILSAIEDEGEMNLVDVDDGDGKTVKIFTK